MKPAIMSLLLLSSVNVFAREGHEGGSFLEFRRERLLAVQKSSTPSSEDVEGVTKASAQNENNPSTGKKCCESSCC